jgi:hypothetical protein
MCTAGHPKKSPSTTGTEIGVHADFRPRGDLESRSGGESEPNASRGLKPALQVSTSPWWLAGQLQLATWAEAFAAIRLRRHGHQFQQSLHGELRQLDDR